MKLLALEFCKCPWRKLTLVCAKPAGRPAPVVRGLPDPAGCGGAGSGVDASALQPGNGGRHYAPYRRGGDCQPEL
ncbi:hypothetical protein M5E87_12340 [Flavonifractor plautii]|nr:hypothetical protein M5E87_12340 [Flavonifractor plautii]